MKFSCFRRSKVESKTGLSARKYVVNDLVQNQRVPSKLIGKRMLQYEDGLIEDDLVEDIWKEDDLERRYVGIVVH